MDVIRLRRRVVRRQQNGTATRKLAPDRIAFILRELIATDKAERERGTCSRKDREAPFHEGERVPTLGAKLRVEAQLETAVMMNSAAMQISILGRNVMTSDA